MQHGTAQCSTAGAGRAGSSWGLHCSGGQGAPLYCHWRTATVLSPGVPQSLTWGCWALHPIAPPAMSGRGALGREAPSLSGAVATSPAAWSVLLTRTLAEILIHLAPGPTCKINDAPALGCTPISQEEMQTHQAEMYTPQMEIYTPQVDKNPCQVKMYPLQSGRGVPASDGDLHL